MKVDIHCFNVRKMFGDVVAIEKFSHVFNEGKIHGIMGHNGAGKTTLLRMIGGILMPTNGTIKIGDALDVRLHAEKIKSITGFLPETALLYKRLTAKEFLEFIGKLRGLPLSKIEERIERYFDLFEFSLPHRQMQDLSRGMQQKILLISSLLHDPAILLLDEPIATLDPISAAITREHIKLLGKQGKNIIIASHIPSFIEKTCNEVVLLDNGHVMAKGTINDILELSKTHSLEDAYLKLMKTAPLTEM